MKWFDHHRKQLSAALEILAWPLAISITLALIGIPLALFTTAFDLMGIVLMCQFLIVFTFFLIIGLDK